MISIKHESQVAYGTANIFQNYKLMQFILQDDSVVFLKSCHFSKLPDIFELKSQNLAPSHIFSLR